jgi:hypothetical protein
MDGIENLHDRVPAAVAGLYPAGAQGELARHRFKELETRASFPDSTVMAAGWAWFMAPPLRTGTMKPYDRKGYRLYVLVASMDHLGLYSYRYRRDPKLAGQLPWRSVRAIDVVPVKPGEEKPGTQVLTLSVNSAGTDLSETIEFYLCADNGDILRGPEFDEAKSRLEQAWSNGTRGLGQLTDRG